MQSNEIRKTFLEFFAQRGHRIVNSSSLVPANDPTLLFSNAGMNQFKDVFLGRERRDYTRACSSQKCVRAGGKHNDLEQVGFTGRHHTFFEMLGNFSFGDYFKKEAIPWAWELVTQDFAIAREKLYVTVFREDDEAERIWAQDVGVPRERIFRLDEKDNFWQMGDTGPCGPCSEIHYDLGSAASAEGHADCKFPCECGRYVELWNLVFMQFNRDEQGNMTPLPRPSIDTGAGLERLACVLQGKLSNFDTDLFRPLIDEAAALADVEYGANHDTDVSLRIIADHARSATFLISEGVLPSNEGRGYVLRLIIRRALYHGQTLGLNEPFLYKMAGHVVQMMKDAYPELLEAEHHVAKAIKIEEERYAHTTRRGLEELEKVSTVTIATGERVPFAARRARHAEWARKFHERYTGFVKVGDRIVGLPAQEDWQIQGDGVFTLHDTFGLRPDFVADIAKNFGGSIDRAGYEAEMARQRERARASWKAIDKGIAADVYLKASEKYRVKFLGYEITRSAGCRVLELVERETKHPPGHEVQWEVLLDKTPFYAESGGQVGDTGWLRIDGKTIATVDDTYSPISGLILHKVRWMGNEPVQPGALVGRLVDAEVDVARRDAIRRNHTATHLLHAALRKTLGTHVKQAGSLVAPDRLRFDFTHYAGLDQQDLLDIEDLVNEQVLANEEVVTVEMPYDEALNSGAMALFQPDYVGRQTLRVLTIADFSKELCGGTHVRRTGDIGLFKIISEGSVAAGTRRIEALTGTSVLEQMRKASETLALLSEALRAKPDGLIKAIEKLTESEKKLRKELEAQQMKRAASAASDLAEQSREVKGVRVIAARVEVTDRSALRQMVDDLRVKLQSGVIVLGSVADGKVSLIAAVTKDLTGKLDAGKIVKQAAAYVEGSGGGRKDLAEAGGKNPAKLDESLQAVPSIVAGLLRET
jgi:alanyl-tRNA synthetase